MIPSKSSFSPPAYLRRSRGFTPSLRALCMYAVWVISVAVLLLTWHRRVRIVHSVSSVLHRNQTPSCRYLAGADQIVVVMKTGANEIQDKLEVHQRTTLNCYPHSIIFSDYEEDLPSGQHVYDAFTYTTLALREEHKDFALWRTLREVGREGIPLEDLSGGDSRERPEYERKLIPGWQLDKWKFLPMVNQTFHLYPDKHWYVFVEADTYLLWSSLLPFLQTKSWKEDHYIGARAEIEGLGFAHGGSGFVLSRSALEKVVDVYTHDQVHWESQTSSRWWVGDHILAEALWEAGITLQDASPSWQGSPLSLVKFGPEHDRWCSPALTFHHQSPPEIEELWRFEQQEIFKTHLFRGAKSRAPRSLTHRDVFREFVLPQMRQQRMHWDNLADNDQGVMSSVGECRSSCEEDLDCLQYQYHEATRLCKTSSQMMLGDRSDEVESGWMRERILQHVASLPACH